VPSLLIIIATVVFSTVSSLVQIRLSKLIMEHEAGNSGLEYAMISGVQKIKLAGAETRVFARWANRYAEGAKYVYDPPTFIKINTVINTAISLFGTIILYYFAVQSGVDQSSYFAFSSAYGSVMGAFTALSGIALTAAKIKPTLEMAKPFLEAEPETSDNREIVSKLTGSIELNNVCFRYDDHSPYIVNNMSLKIKPGEYVAIVGKTGCGKSTLMRLLSDLKSLKKARFTTTAKTSTGLISARFAEKSVRSCRTAGCFRATCTQTSSSPLPSSRLMTHGKPPRKPGSRTIYARCPWECLRWSRKARAASPEARSNG
jgi:ABC-type bacteriocin/lantibiotic exporter with double-glycine peptidase domain